MATSFGKPAINVPRALDLRAVQQSIANIRERFVALENATTTTASREQIAQLAAQFASLLPQLSSLATRVTILETAASTDIVVLTANETISAYTPIVPIGTGGCEEADPSDPLRMFSVIGVALNGATVGGQVRVQRRGPLTLAGSSFEVGRAVYAQFGGFTQTPNYEATALPIGVAITSTALWVSPDWPALLDAPFPSGVDDTFLRYLPVTYELLQQAVSNITPGGGNGRLVLYDLTGRAILTLDGKEIFVMEP